MGSSLLILFMRNIAHMGNVSTPHMGRKGKKLPIWAMFLLPIWACAHMGNVSHEQYFSTSIWAMFLMFHIWGTVFSFWTHKKPWNTMIFEAFWDAPRGTWIFREKRAFFCSKTQISTWNGSKSPHSCRKNPKVMKVTDENLPFFCILRLDDLDLTPNQLVGPLPTKINLFCFNLNRFLFFEFAN